MGGISSRTGGMRFSCGGDQADPTSAPLCLNEQAVCARDPIGREMCICPEGYGHDFVFGHDPNCAKPDWFLPVVFGISTCGIGLALFLYVRELLRLKGTQRRIMQVLITALSLDWLHILCVFVQNGCYAAGMVFAALFSPTIAYLAYIVILLLTAPVYSALKRPMHRWRCLVGTLTLFFGLSVMLVLLASLAFIGDPEQSEIFNAFVTASHFGVGSSYLVLVSVTLLKVYELERLIKGVIRINSQNLADGSDKLSTVLTQLQALKKVLWVLMGNSVVIIPGIVYLILGSVPYAFLMWAAYWISMWPVAPFVVRFVRSRQEKPQNEFDLRRVGPKQVQDTPPRITTPNRNEGVIVTHTGTRVVTDPLPKEDQEERNGDA